MTSKSTAGKDETGIRRVLATIGAKLLNDPAHVGFIENTDLPQGQRGTILRSEIFDLAGKSQGSGEICTHRDNTVVRKQARLSTFQGGHPRVAFWECV